MANSEQKPSVIRSAMMMSAGTMGSRVFGFIRDAMIFALFDRTITDAFVVGFRIPNLFRRIFGEGSLSVSFIPIFVEQLQISESKAKDLANATFSALMSITSMISLLLYIYMDRVVWMLVGSEKGYASIPGKIEMTIFFSRIMVIYLVLVTSYAFFMAICNALHHFFWPAFAQAIYNIAAIIFSVLPTFSTKGDVLAWGVVAGGLAQFLTTAWVLYKVGFVPRFTLKWRHTGFAWVVRNMGPGMFGLGVFQVMTLVNTRFAASLAEGTQSYIYAADRVLELPQSLIAISLGTALLPRYSEYLAKKQNDLLLEEARSTLKLLLYLSIPSAIGMFFLSVPMTDVLFRRGSFNTNDTYQTALVVQVYSFLLIFSSISKVTVPAFYAMKNTTLPAVVAAFVLFIHIGLGYFLVNQFGLIGLASATMVSSFLNMVILQMVFFSRFGRIGNADLYWSILRLLPASLVLAAICYFGHPWMKEWIGSRIATLSVNITVGAVVYFFLTYYSGSPEAHRLLGRFFGRLPKALFFARR